MERKKNRKWIIMSIVVVLIITAVLVINSRNKAGDDDNTSIFTPSGEVTYSCYDYIMDTMAAPQVYDEQWIPQYDFALYNEIATEKMPNGSGFKYDEETNTFCRGYLSILRLDFENNMAYEETIEDYNPAGPVDNREATYKTTCVYDFANRVYWYTNDENKKYDLMTPKIYLNKDYGPSFYEESLKEMVYDHNELEELPYTYYIENEYVPGEELSTCSPFTYYENREDKMEISYIFWSDVEEYEFSYYSIPWHIEKIMHRYNMLFEEAGCALYGTDKAKLETYKSKQANVVKKETTKLDGPWQFEGFDWSYENSDIDWIDDYRSVFELDVPDIEHDEDGYLVEAPVYVFFMKGDYSPKYFCDSENHVIDSSFQYENISGAIAQYLLKPALEKAYGFNAAFFYPIDKVASEIAYNEITNTPDYELYMSGKRFNFKANEVGGFALKLLPKRDDKSIVNADNYSYYVPDYYMNWFTIEDLYCRLNKSEDFPYSNDYFFNFLCMYNKEYQLSMGLR